MLPTKGYAAESVRAPLKPFSFERREPGANDVLIEISHCGVCHSDVHQARDEWGGSIFPMVPGHEIVGKVTKVGAGVKKFKVGDLAGVGCFVDSCRECASCKEGEEQYCERGMNATYNGTDKAGKPTFGGYSNQITVDEKYTLRIPPGLALDRTAPLLCAGITTYSPLKHWKVGRGSRVAVMGLGGLGHMGVKIAAAMGAEVTVLSTSMAKQEDAKRLGAQKFASTKDEKTFETYAGYFDFILNTVAADHDLNKHLDLLKRDGTMVLVGIPEKPIEVHAFSLVPKRRSFSGSMIGGIRETQEMLDFCAAHNVLADVEVIPMSKINEAYDRMVKSDVRYRFVIDMKTL